MKLLRNSIYIVFGLSMALSGCEEDSTGGLSQITHFPEFTYNGDEFVIVERGTEFNDPGVTATESGASIPVTVTSSGTYFESTLDVNKPDIYTVSYFATNSDGFPGAQTRTVIVAGQGDLVTNIEGLYTSTVGRDGAATEQYTDMEYVLIRKTGDNTYELSDGIGGYYDLGRAYGPGYAAAPPAVITANDIAANDFTFGTFAVGSFGGNVTMVSFAVDPGARTITFKSTWSGYTFNVTLTQVEL